MQNPTIVVDSGIVIKFQNSLQTINTSINGYNHNVATYNNGITTFRNSIQSIANAQAEVDRLKKIKKRFEPPIIALCTQLVTERQTLRSLEAAYSQLIIQQETATRTFFSNYRDRINHYLETVFRTLFKIDDVINIPPEGRATESKIGYKLTIDGQDISFEADEPNCAKDCLSEKKGTKVL